ncbi:16S rRNA (guanine(966)-N(2))-methyltransferase RsmD [Schaalia suimastitidis]|uniref:16S rRNA (guanine(966)-N(2))-methyltransferase RsmD n=1 Tax=Schaalia suimastitidis TaxID=121163 RepID=UPI00041ADA1F|nr:16S rRNA (guanine(966)-N(2))-methyltransferase RsmD [Schaalia suimastitidis]
MTRIVAGTAKGRVLQVPSKGTRPTSERVREALFSRLVHWGVIDEAMVLDLFAGSGALGLEALSRGAGQATFVDSGKDACRVIQANIAATGLRGQVCRNDVVGYLAAGSEAQSCRGEVGLVFIDPPYDIAEQTLTDTLGALGPWITPDALIVVERSKRSPQPNWPTFLQCEDVSTWGETVCWFAGPPLNAKETQ